MLEVNESNVLEYLAERVDSIGFFDGLTADQIRNARAKELAFGVSNIVVRFDAADRSLVVKQSREQLRTEIDWFSQLDRIWREVDVLRTIGSLAGPVRDSVPTVLFEDRDNFLFGMEAIEAGHLVWKSELLAGRIDLGLVQPLAGFLARVHTGTTNEPEVAREFGDRVVFDELRLDPFYRYMATNIPELSEPLLQLIDDCMTRADCLVLADFSPKNILLRSSGQSPVVVDFETGHFGDPGFDIGFFLSHLLLKSVYHAGGPHGAQMIKLASGIWQAYQNQIQAVSVRDPERTVWNNEAFDARSARHLAACMLSRVDGKSRVDYLTESGDRQLVRRFCHDLLTGSEQSVHRAIEELASLLGDCK